MPFDAKQPPRSSAEGGSQRMLVELSSGDVLSRPVLVRCQVWPESKAPLGYPADAMLAVMRPVSGLSASAGRLGR